MGRSKITINKRNGALGRRNPSTDSVCALVTTGIAVAGTGNLALNTGYPMRSTRDAIAIGITESYDSANGVLVYHHIERFFLRNPDATLYLMVAAQTNSLEDLADLTNDFAKKLLKDQNGKIKFVGITRNPLPDYEPVLTTGLDADVIAAVAKAQALHTDEFSVFRYACFLIEGRSFNGTAAAALDLRTLDAPQVSVTIAADPAISGLNAAYEGYAAVGDVLGLISKAAVSQNIGEFSEDFNLSDAGRNLFVTAGLSSNLPISSYSDADLDTLHDKGYIFPTTEPGITGIYLNDSATCSELQDNDYAYIENNRTILKAIELARVSLLAFIKKRVYVDPETGFMEAEDVKTIETTGNKSIAGMKTDGDISGGIDCYVDPEQNVLATSKVEVELTFTPVSIAREITLSIGFSNPFKS